MKIKYFIIVLIMSLCSFTAYSQTTSGKKVYLSPFVYKSEAEEYSYFKRSLPNSLRTSLSQKINVKLGDKQLSRLEMYNKGFNYYISGNYKVTKKEIFVTFSLIHIKTNVAVLIAFAHGSKQGTKIFDSIDGMVKLILQILEKPTSEIIKKSIILSVDQEGNIKQSDESLEGLDLSGGNFTGADFSNKNLANANLSGANLTNVKLVNSNLNGTNFTNSILINTDFTGANIENAVFKNAKGMSIYNNLHQTKNRYKAKYDAHAINIINTPGYGLEIYLGPGLTHSQSQLITGGDVYAQFSGLFGIRGMLKIGYYVGFFADIGYQAFRIKEKDPDSDFIIAHDIHYLFINLGPMLVYKTFAFYMGAAFNILLKGTEYTGQNGETEDSSRSLFHELNFGFIAGFKYKYYTSNKFDLTAAVEFKYQLSNFRQNFSMATRIFGIYLTLGIAFRL